MHRRLCTMIYSAHLKITKHKTHCENIEIMKEKIEDIIILLAEWRSVITFISFIRCSLEFIPRSFVSTCSSHSDKISLLTFSSLKVSWYCFSPKASNSVSTYCVCVCVCVCVCEGGREDHKSLKEEQYFVNDSHIFCTYLL